MQAVILAGGKGTRLGDLVKEIPKPMVRINNKPILQHQIENLKKYNIKDIILIVGYLGDTIADYFKDGAEFGVKISYIFEKELLGTAGSLYYLHDKIKEDFILLFGDLIIDIDWNKFVSFHKENKGLITLFAHPNSHPFDSDLILTEGNKVVGVDSKHNIRNYYYKNLVNAGIYICTKDVVNYVTKPEKIDFEKVVLSHFINEKQACAYVSSEYVKDAGTLERLNRVTEDINSGVVASKNLSNKQKCIFLDRDGTINKYVGFLRNIDDFDLIDGVSTAIKKINESKYLCICITNQPVIARGEVTVEQLNNIHNKMMTLLGKDGAYLDDIYYCPHHPDSGFEGEIKELKIKCDCRKPGIGLLKKAAEKFNIDLESSWFIGDSDLDVKTGKNARSATILLKNDAIKQTEKADYNCNNLLEAIDLILKNN